MKIELTEDQSRAIENTGDMPPSVTDPRTQKSYVLLRTDVFERIKALVDEGGDVREAYPAVDRAFAAGWDGPKMDAYDRYEEHQPSGPLAATER